MSGTLQGATYYVTELPTTTRFLLCALADHADDKGLGVWPGNERLALKTGVSVRHVQRTLKELEEDGWIARVAFPGGGRGHAVAWAVNAARIYATARENGWTQETPVGIDFAPKGDSGVTVSELQPEPERVTSDALKGDIQRERVTSDALKGDVGVTPTVREPSVEPSEEPLPTTNVGASIVEFVSETSETHLDPADTRDGALPARTRPRDEVFEAVAAVCYGDDWPTELTETARGPLNRAVKELRAVGATPLDVAERSRAYIGWLGQKPTPMALVKHWPRLGDPIQQLPRHELEALNEEQAMEVRMAEAERRERQRLAEEAARAAEAAEVVPIRQLGPDPAVSPSVRHPRRPGESVREYVARIGRISVGADRPGDRDEDVG